jgi:V/A-type H+-transporting ATPase subunit I
MLEEVSAAKRVITKLEGIDYAKDADSESILKASKEAVLAENLTEGAQKALVELMELEALRTSVAKEVSLRRPWGEFDKSRLDSLETLGYAVRYYIVPAKKFSAEWGSLYPLEIISRDSSNVWFVTICPKGEEYIFPVDAVSAPEGSWKEAQATLDDINVKISTVKGALLKYKEAIPQMQTRCEKELTDLDMYLAAAATESAAENKLSVLEGFAPVENDAALCSEFDKMGILYIKEDAAEADNPPIRLRNKKFV